MKAIKSFCEENNLDFGIIEKDWLGYKEEKLK
jgi:hypothetical protein